MWIGPSPSAATASRSASGVTARSECGATPTRASGSACTIARVRASSAAIAVRIVEETLLALVRRRAAEAAVHIESGQQRQADAGLLRRRGDARRHLAEVGIRPAVDVVMQVVELADGGEAGLEHLHVGERRDRLDVVRRELAEEAVHHLAPGPEAVIRRAACSASPAMPRWNAWQCRFGMPGIASPRCAAHYRAAHPT